MQMEEDGQPVVREQNKTRGDMTRSTQTLWILTAIFLSLWAILYFATRLPDSSPYAKCQQIIGPMDSLCRENVTLGVPSSRY